MAAVAQSAEQVSDMLQNLKVDSNSKSGDTTTTEQAPPSQDGNSSDGSGDASASGGTGDAASTNGAHDGVMEPGVYYTPNGYPHGYVYEYPHGGVAGFEGPVPGEWEDYTARYVSVDGVEIPGQVYSENGQVLYHPTFGYTQQQAYGPYNPGGAPIPTMGADGQLYGPQAFQFQGHMYSQPVSPGAQYISTPTSMAGDAPTSGVGEPGPPGVEGGNGAGSNGSNVSMGPRPGYPVTLIPAHGPYARGVLPLAIQHPQDQRSYEGLRAGAPSWADVTKITENQQRPGAPAMHIVSQPLAASGIPSQTLRPMTPLQLHISSAPPQRTHAIPSPTLRAGALARGYPPLARVIPSPNGSGRGGRGLQGSGMDARTNGRGWVGVDKGKPRGRGAGPLSNGNGNLDILNEQNRGPRTTRIRTQRTTPGVLRHTRGQGAASNGSDALSALTNREQYNRPDFSTKYEQAKFFVIKSYSEDDVHKSIKYNVWASTPNGNKRLDGAYQDAQSRNGPCPVFFFFSVNASGQFCGVAEMTGPVDFNKSVDFWQQDKWNGRFPVKWHIIKDIPNCQFRHIILENNDNKPVTNSRDTQEVKFEQGLDMLNIFKSYASKTSILDDFQFYESRQRAMQEKRARQQAQQQREIQRQQGGGRLLNEPEQARPVEIVTPKVKVDKAVETVSEESVDLKAVGSTNADGSLSTPVSESGPSEATLLSKLSLTTLSAPKKEEAGPANDSKMGALQGFKEDKEHGVANATPVVDDKLVEKEPKNASSE